MTELDKQLLAIANKNWDQFTSMIGGDAIVKAKICLLRKNKFSYGQIQTKLKVTKSQIETACNKCPPNF